jgi:acyl carrier protein
VITPNDIKDVLANMSSRFESGSLNENEPLTLQGLDSLDTVNLLLAVEDRFKVEIPAIEVGLLRSLSDISKFVNNAQQS